MVNRNKNTSKRGLIKWLLGAGAGLGLAATMSNEGHTPVNYSPQEAQVIAHRRHSLKDIEQALEAGADMVEFDLRRTKDGEFVAYHDPKIGGRSINGTDYSELSGVSKVEDLLEHYGDRIKWDTHLKEQGYEADAVDFLDSYLERDSYIITSENLESLKKIRGQNPDLQLGLILLKGKLGYKVPLRKLKARYAPFRLLKDVVENEIDFIVPDRKFVSRGLLEESGKQGVQVIPWVVDNPQEFQGWLNENSVYGIITSKPGQN